MCVGRVVKSLARLRLQRGQPSSHEPTPPPTNHLGARSEKAFPARQEEQIYSNFGGELKPTPAPGGIAGTGVLAFMQMKADGASAPPPAPEAFGAYAKRSQESNGVIAMLDMLVADLDKEITEAETEEKNAQAAARKQDIVTSMVDAVRLT